MDGSTLLPPSGQFQGAQHLFPIRVYYEDTDLSGMVYHANYLRWFERARSDMLRLLGIDQRSAAESGEGLYAVTVVTDAAELGAASVRLRQRALKGGDLLAEAFVRVGFISPDGRPRRQPAVWRAAFETLQPAKDPA